MTICFDILAFAQSVASQEETGEWIGTDQVRLQIYLLEGKVLFVQSTSDCSKYSLLDIFCCLNIKESQDGLCFALLCL